MFHNYLKVAIRSIFNNRIYTTINVIGLATGITVSLLILLYVNHEFSYDTFHKNLPQIYRMLVKLNFGGQEVNTMAVSAQFGPMTMQNDGAIENYVRTRNPGRVLIKAEGKEAEFENEFLFADSSFFNVFSFPLISGNRNSLAEPGQVFITESTARKFFGDQDARGQILYYQNELPLQVAGVAKNVPSNSSIRFSMVASFPTLGLINSEKSHYEHKLASLGAYITYFQLKPGQNQEHAESTFKKIQSESVEEKYLLEPLAGSYLHGGMVSSGPQYLYLFITIAIVVLVLALINYLSLSTARATVRAKEVGIRKTIGALKSNLARQFFVESSLITSIAFILAIGLFQLVLPLFVSILDFKIDLNYVFNFEFLAIAVTLLLVCIAIAGFYPALVLSKFKPIDVLKGKVSIQGGGTWVRKSFTVLQFAACIGLILFALVVHRQMDFIQQKNLGLYKAQVMAVNLDPSMSKNLYALKNELRSRPEFEKVSAASLPLYQNGTSAFFTKTPTTNEEVMINNISADEEFFSTLNIEWKEIPSKNNLIGKLLVNEAGLSKLKLSTGYLGKKLKLGNEEIEIVGVVKDFNFESLHTKISGLVIYVEADTARTMADSYGALYIRLNSTENLSENIKLAESIVKKHQGDKPFEYYFLDDAFDKLYRSEMRMAKIFDALTVLAIFIASLGLLGLVTFTAEVRTKEIGIRKILGASIRNIIILLSRTYFILILVGACLVLPLAWWYAQQWLSGFAYKTELPWWYSIITVALVFVLAMATTTYQSFRSAVRNPVESLRRE